MGLEKVALELALGVWNLERVREGEIEAKEESGDSLMQTMEGRV